MFDDLLKTIFNETVNESNSNTNNESKSDNESDYESDNESDIEGENDKYYYKIRQLNNWFETIDQTKSLEVQIELLKEREEYWYVKHYHDNKELNYKIFKAKSAYVLNDIPDNSFVKVFGCKFATLVDKLINTTSKEENQIIIEDIKNNKSKIYEEYRFDDSIFKQRGNLDDAVKIILEINEALTSDKDDND